MYSLPLGMALNYGQSMVPGKAAAPKNANLQKAILQRNRKKKNMRKARQESPAKS